MSDNAKKVVEASMRRQKHSDFYYKLNELTHKLHVFTDNFKPRVPKYELAFKKRQLEQ